MRLSVNLFTTFDGVSQAPGGPDEDTSGGFACGGWLMPHADADMGEIVDAWFGQADAFLLGRRTYETFAAYWPQVTDEENDVGRLLNTLPKHVATSTLTDADVSWEGTHLLVGDVLSAVRELKERPGRELQVHGSIALARSLHEAGLVDVYRLLRFPVVVGSGKRLFDDSGPSSEFTVTALRATSTGAVHTELVPRPFSAGTAAVVDGKDTIVLDGA